MSEHFNPIDHPILFAEPRRVSITTPAWVGHIPFALGVVDMARPRRIVELGTHFGNSYCALCQAVSELKLETRCSAVDTWQGDKHSGLENRGPYGTGVFDDLRAYHDPLYSGFSTLLRMTFDEALEKFEDGSIDLLHIDGLHTYQAVKHDFEAWKPKLSERAVVMLHDTVIMEHDFGVHQLWAELKGAYPSFEFKHSNGLGVLLVGPNAPAPLLSIARAAGPEAEAIHLFFASIGNGLQRRMELDFRLSRITNSRYWKLFKLLKKLRYGR